MFSQKYTFGECRDTVMKMLERYCSNGSINTCGEIKDIENRLRTYINIHLRKLYAEFPERTARSEIVLEAPKKSYDFGTFEVSDEPAVTQYAQGDKLAFHITASGYGSIMLFVGGSMKSYSVDTVPGEVAVVSDIIDNSSDEQIQFIVSAQTSLSIHSFVVYEGFDGARAKAEFIPYPGKCCAKMPEDFGKLSEIFSSDGHRVDARKAGFEFFGGMIYADEKYAGIYTFEYFPLPVGFEEGCGEAEEICISPVLFDALCYMCAADLCPASEGELYAKLMYKYREILENYYDRTREMQKTRNTFYGVIKRGRANFGRNVNGTY